MIRLDDCRTVKAESPEAIDAAAYALPVATSGAPFASEGLILCDRAVIRRGARPGFDGEAASEPVATFPSVAAVATLGDVVIEGATGDRQDGIVCETHKGVEADADAGAQAFAAVGPGAAVAALGLVITKGPSR